jgi:hypothetical protein
VPQRNPRELLSSASALLEFRPWMLAVAVLLGCALGVALLEQFRGPPALWAEVIPQEAPAPR